jgi:hypothetical protein
MGHKHKYMLLFPQRITEKFSENKFSRNFLLTRSLVDARYIMEKYNAPCFEKLVLNKNKHVWVSKYTIYSDSVIKLMGKSPNDDKVWEEWEKLPSITLEYRMFNKLDWE